MSENTNEDYGHKERVPSPDLLLSRVLKNQGELAALRELVSERRAADRELIELGTLSMTAMSPEQFSTQKMLLFNPLLLQDGIEPSADPVLLARPGAYAISYGQRLK